MKISPNEIHLWFIPDEEIIDDAVLSNCLALLNEEESKQQQRFHFQRHRHQYLITRSFLRQILSFYCSEVAPPAWRFVKNAYGKPSIANVLSSPLTFNLSHTGGRVVVAVGTSQAIGVDIESRQRHLKFDSLVTSVFLSQEIAYFKSLPQDQQSEYFFELWTIKEAFVKACGKGIATPISDIECAVRNQQLVCNLTTKSVASKNEIWQFWQIDPGNDYQMALAVASSNNLISQVFCYQTTSLTAFTQLNFPVLPIPAIITAPSLI